MKAVAQFPTAGASDGWTGQPIVHGLMTSGSPCAIVDRSGLITRANPAFVTLTGECEGLRTEDVFFTQTSVDSRKRVARIRPIEALYYETSGTLVPAWLHTICESPVTGDRLLLLADGSPLRRASEKQLDAAPLAVMRVCAKAIVRFANAETYRALSLAPGDVLGHTLTSLFGKSGMGTDKDDELFTQRLCTCFTECLDTLKPVTLDVWVAHYTQNERETAQMRMIPDLAPDGRPLGVLAVIELTLEDRVRARIAEIARDASMVWQERLGLVLKQVARLIKFRHANFGMYANEMRLFRAFALYPSDKFLWKERWLDLPEGMKEWAQSGKTFISDMQDFLDKYPTFQKSEVVRMYQDQGIRASVTLVAKDDKGPTSALSLCSCKVGHYSQRDVEILRNLNLEPVLIRIEEQILHQRMAVALHLKHMLSTNADISDVACEAVRQLASTFQWDYVSLYRVERQSQKFELYYESNCPPEFRIDTGYTQDLDEGMLGECFRRGEEHDKRFKREGVADADQKSRETLIVNDVGNQDVEQYRYIGLERGIVRSAMTVPLRLNGRIRWMFHIESHEAQAFHGPDLDAIIKVVELVEEGLMQRAIQVFNRKIMEETRQGIVMVGLEGAILGVNDAASRLLGLKRDQKPEHDFLHEYACEADAVSGDVLRALGSTEKRRIELQGEDGQVRSVLATRRTLEGSFDTAIWFLIDLQAREWEVGMRFLRATVSDVAQETRAPLALASNIARQLPQLCSAAQPSADATDTTLKSDAEALSRRLLAELKKADITFERLAKNYDIRRYPLRKRLLSPIDLAETTDDVIYALPARDRRVIRHERPSGFCSRVHGDRERIEFAIRSLVAYMLRVRADEQNVVISFGPENHLVRMRFALSDMQPVPALTDQECTHDVMWRAFRTAREDACLGLAAVKRVIKAHGGSLDTEATPWANENAAPPWIAFHLTLPVMNGDKRP